MTLDTGAEQTVVSAKMARRLGLPVMGLTLSAGVGMVGMRGLQISKMESIEIGGAEGPQRDRADQEACAGGHAQRRAGLPLAAGARAVGDGGLQGAAGDAG